MSSDHCSVELCQHEEESGSESAHENVVGGGKDVGEGKGGHVVAASMAARRSRSLDRSSQQVGAAPLVPTYLLASIQGAGTGRISGPLPPHTCTGSSQGDDCSREASMRDAPSMRDTLAIKATVLSGRWRGAPRPGGMRSSGGGATPFVRGASGARGGAQTSRGRRAEDEATTRG